MLMWKSKGVTEFINNTKFVIEETTNNLATLNIVLIERVLPEWFVFVLLMDA